jgi:hypothetical protein
LHFSVMQMLYASINKEEVGYLIHGQPFFFEFGIEGAKYLIIDHKLPMRGKWWKRFRFSKPEGSFFSVTNAYSPEIRIYAFSSYFSLWPEKFVLPLKINFLNTIRYQPELSVPSPNTGNHKVSLSHETKPYKHSFPEPGLIGVHCDIREQKIFINNNLIQYP